MFDAHYRERDRGQIEALLESLALGEVVRGLPGGIDALIRESHAALSLGQRQRLLLARALYSSRPVLLLDEPTANLDDDTAAIVMETIHAHCQKAGKSLIVVTHSDARWRSTYDAEIALAADRWCSSAGRCDRWHLGVAGFDLAAGEFTAGNHWHGRYRKGGAGDGGSETGGAG